MNTHNPMPCHITDGPEFEPPAAIEDGEQISREQAAERFDMSLSDAEWEELLRDALGEALDVRDPVYPALDSPLALNHYQRSLDACTSRRALLFNLRRAYKCANHAEVGRIVSTIMAQCVERVAEDRI